MREVFARLGHERGYAMFELLVVMVVLGVVIAGLAEMFVSASNAQLEMSRRFDAQQNARLALDRIRREVHCASAVSPTGASGNVVLTLPAGCPTGSGNVRWCTRGSGQRFALYRIAPDPGSCTGGVFTADYLTTGTVFDYSSPAPPLLAELRVDFPVDLTPADAIGRYRLKDEIVLRNDTRY